VKDPIDYIVEHVIPFRLISKEKQKEAISEIRKKDNFKIK